MDRVGPVALAVSLAALAVGACDTGDGRALRPPPPTTTPPPTVTTTSVPAVTTFDDGFGDLNFTEDGGAGTDLGFAVTLCRWRTGGTAGASDAQPVLTVTAEGVTVDGDRYALTLEDTVVGDQTDGSIAISFTSGPFWRATAPGGQPPELEVVEQTAGLVVRAEVEVTETDPSDGTRALGLAALDLTCL
jgi:hypothetical protein